MSSADKLMVYGFELESIDKAFLAIFEGLVHTSYGTQLFDAT